MKDQMEVCPLSRGVMLPVGATPIHPITDGLRFFHLPLPAPPIGSPCGLLSLLGEIRAYHVPHEYHEWVRSRLSAGGADICDRR